MTGKSYKRLRREAYLKKWPLHKQMEAMQDREAGDTTLWDQLQADFVVIRETYPKPA